MEKRLMELLAEEVLTEEEFTEVEESAEVVNVENCGLSGRYIGYLWFNVVLENGDEYDIYLEN